jgi:hemerythrin-like domain-containing protein
MCGRNRGLREALRTTLTEDGMEALALLKKDHGKVKELMRKLEKTEAPKAREELFGRLKADLQVHEIIEEEIFYPTLKKHPRAKDIVLEGIEEHNVVDHLMGELSAMSTKSETWGPKCKVMIENIEHHIEEEEGEMFRKARQVFERDELEDLGERMTRRKAEAAGELGTGSRR